jgi:hypothetical protein
MIVKDWRRNRTRKVRSEVSFAGMSRYTGSSCADGESFWLMLKDNATDSDKGAERMTIDMNRAEANVLFQVLRNMLAEEAP